MSAFHYLRSLSVSLAAVIRFADVGAELQSLLKTRPRLESLSLWCCGGLRLASLAKLCPELKTLRLVSCEISSDDTPLHYDAFPKLRTVELCIRLLKVVFDAFFYATSGTLRNLRLVGDASCRGCLHDEPISFPCLEELTLGIAFTIDALQREPEDLHNLLTSLPALRHLSTDSYDLFRELLRSIRQCLSDLVRMRILLRPTSLRWEQRRRGVCYQRLFESRDVIRLSHGSQNFLS
ncbi:hypothetical protein V5799_027631 [Amblyomma americanum]|uniref:Uncharacterized protein n=1 Tax=Amblyomma americanum TaxID=6943 RepID=A0AAQ4DF62_AMBAM